LVYSIQALCLRTNRVELPKNHGIAKKYREEDDCETEDQTRTDVEPMGVKGLFSNSFCPGGELCRNVTPHRCSCQATAGLEFTPNSVRARN
jgi:hypothetical protein